jgi:hypothetical protein
MPKYVLGTNGNVIDLETNGSGSNGENPEAISNKYVARGGAAHDSDGDFFKTADVDLPTGLNFDKKGRHAISAVPSPQKDVSGLFPNKEFAGDHNSSFGADTGFDKYINFNNYHTRNEIFATELEIAGTGIDLNSGGLRDLTKFTLAFELIIEAIAYIATIEAILQTERAIESNINLGSNFLTSETDASDITPSSPIIYEKGNYGPTSYTAITRYFNDILNYPVTGYATINPLSDGGLSERLSAFFIGMNHYINPDPQIDSVRDILFSQSVVLKDPRSPLLSAFNYLADSVLTLSNIETNRLMLLVRRFNQKSDWHENRLYKAKSDTKENAVEKFLIELNYYYVKFIIERIHVGQKSIKYFYDRRLKKLNRSGRLKDSISSNGLNSLSYKNHKLSIENKAIDELSEEYQVKQSMSNSLLPQAFIMPRSLKASYYNNKGRLLGQIAEKFVDSYFLETEKPQERLSNDVVKKLEAHYEKEMMPFYFQDLRTNEIIGFHAFIESITDNFNPNYTQTKGFGRIDDVRHYVDTTRNVNITFALAAMSKEDHDLMWYQINKIVSMVYPQWSRGFEASPSDDPNANGFEYPFTQVPTASPLIRIRLGDVIKSNYTKHAIEKIHGSGNNNNISLEKKPIEYVFSLKPKTSGYETLEFIARNTLSDFTIANSLKDSTRSIVFTKTKIEKLYNYKHTIVEDSTRSKISQYQLVSKINDVSQINSDSEYVAMYKLELNKKFNRYVVVNGSDIVSEIKSGGELKNKVNLEENRKAFKSYTSSYTGSDPKILNNPITAAYETTLGKGLAGFITMLDVNYQDQLWETEVDGSKAPKLVKLTINFAPLHDIPPGLDADGAMRAPVYNTGRIVNTLYGDVYDKD